ncbi:MAG: hypothetical protein OHK0029_06520 [Armatimonadaceae bacterium]
MLWLMAGATAPTWAQETSPSQSGGSLFRGTTPPADVQAVMDQVADLDLLKALLPLRLTEEQRVKLLDVVKAAAAANSRRRDEEYANWRKVREQVNQAHASALTGKPLPPEAESAIVQALTDSERRFEKARKEMTNRIYAGAREIFTPRQRDEIEQQASKMLGGKRLVPREYKDNPSQAPKDVVQDLMLQVYVERILLFERTIYVLEKMRLGDPNTNNGTGLADGS